MKDSFKSDEGFLLREPLLEGVRRAKKNCFNRMVDPLNGVFFGGVLGSLFSLHHLRV